MIIVKKVIFVLFSTGWFIPLILSISSVFKWIESDVYPLLYKKEQVVSSFPFMDFAGEMFIVFSFWFILVLLLWSYKAYNLFFEKEK